MAAITPTPKLIRPGYGAITQAIIVGEALSMGHAVAINQSSGKAMKSANASGKCAGLVVAGDQRKSDGSLANGELATVVLFGLVHGFSGLTPGKLVYLGATAGTLADTGTVPIGYAWDANTVMVMPAVANAAS